MPLVAKMRRISIVIVGLMFCAVSLATVGFLAVAPNASAETTYTAHAPIYIDGNSGFTAENGVTGGNGTETDPYIIGNWKIPVQNEYGIRLQNADAFVTIQNCEIYNSNQQGRGIWLYKNTNVKMEKIIVHNIEYNAGFILENSFNTTMSNCTAFNCDGGIAFYESSNNTVFNCVLINNYKTGIYLSFSSEIAIVNCSINTNSDGISLSSSSKNTISNCEICNNSYNGIGLGDSSNNTITNNKIANHSIYGLYIGGRARLSGNNRIYQNEFNANYPQSRQANDYNGNNFWNGSEKGNRWSSWTGPDANRNGIVDNPYELDGGTVAKDYYPIAMKTVPGRITGLEMVPSNKQISLSWNPPDDDGGLDIDYYIIYRNGAEIAHSTTTSYVDTNLKRGQNYYYGVTAHNALGETEILYGVNTIEMVSVHLTSIIEEYARFFLIAGAIAISVIAILVVIVIIIKAKKKKKMRTPAPKSEVEWETPTKPIKCPACGTIFKISTTGPLKIKCPNCGKSGTLK
jgi:parallel beta-helix repeat protein